MSHYEERLEADLERIRNLVADMGEAVEHAVQQACHALLTADQQLAAQTILGDNAINNRSRELDRRCHAFVALHLPSARHLRYISSALRLSIALERIGDYAETISRTAVQLSDVPPRTVAGDIQMLSDQSCRLLRLAMESFNVASADMARGAIELSGQFATTVDKVFQDLLAVGQKGRRPLNDLFNLLATFNRLERIIHQAKNICEETVFVVTGETKPPKAFDILFLDEKNDGASQLAERLASRIYADSGSYASAGWAPARTLDSAYVEFADARGLELTGAKPTSYRAEYEPRLAEFDIVVALDPNGREHVPKIPFHTVFLQWDIDTSDGPAETYKQIAGALAELMERLRGTDE